MISSKKQQKNEFVVALFIVFVISTGVIYFRYLKDFDTAKVSARSTVIMEEKTGPKPNDTYVVRNFFTLTDDGKVDEALDIIVSTIGPDSNIRDAWAVGLKNMYYIKVRTLDGFQSNLWTESKHRYLLRLDVQLKDPAVPTTWQNGENVRYVTVSKIGDLWKISEINQTP